MIRASFEPIFSLKGSSFRTGLVNRKGIHETAEKVLNMEYPVDRKVVHESVWPGSGQVSTGHLEQVQVQPAVTRGPTGYVGCRTTYGPWTTNVPDTSGITTVFARTFGSSGVLLRLLASKMSLLSIRDLKFNDNIYEFNATRPRYRENGSNHSNNMYTYKISRDRTSFSSQGLSSNQRMCFRVAHLALNIPPSFP